VNKVAAATSRLNRRTGVFLLLASGLVLLGLGAVPWVDGKASIPGSAADKIASSGGQAAPVIPALGLIVLAAAVALALARRIGVVITCVITAAAGIATTVASGVVLNDPVGAMRSEVTETTAIVLPPEAITGVSITIWVAIAAVFGMILLLISLVLARASGSWEADARHEKDRAEAVDSPGEELTELADADLWDLLSDGQDPTP